MADEREKSVRFIAKLIALTQEREISWKLSEANVYLSQIQGRMVRIRYVSRSIKKAGSAFTRTVSVPVLDLLDKEGRSTYAFSDIAGLSDLMTAVKTNAANVDEFMDDVLKI